jgi:hypothetical protein
MPAATIPTGVRGRSQAMGQEEAAPQATGSTLDPHAAADADLELLEPAQVLLALGVGPCAVVTDRESLLAERVESLVSQEHAAWVSHREEAASRIGGPA